MELRSSRIEKRRSRGQKTAKGQRKRRRSLEGQYVGESKNLDSVQLRCLVEGDMWENSSSTEYDPSDEESEDSDETLSLESESVGRGGLWGASCGGDDDAVQVGKETVGAEEMGSGSSSYGGSDGGQCRSIRSASKGQKSGEGKGKGKAATSRTECVHGGPCVGEAGIVLRLRCAMRKLVTVNAGMSNRQREAVMGTVWGPVLQYPEIEMERHLTLALIKCWVPRWKAFRVGGRRVPFSVFDVALMTGLLATGRRVELEGEEVSTEVGVLVRGRVAEWERAKMAGRVAGRSGKKRRFFRNYVTAMAQLCEENNGEEQVGLWLRLYVFLVLSEVLFPRTPSGAAWNLFHYVEDVHGMAEYAWAEAVWRVIIESIEDTQRKLAAGPLSEVQLNGFCVLIQVWFYEHTSRFAEQDKRQFPRVRSWVKVDHGGRYDAEQLLRDIKEDEVIPVLHLREHEMQQSVVQQFMGTDAYTYYVKDGEGCLSVDERLRRAREAYAVERTAHHNTKTQLQHMEEMLLELKTTIAMYESQDPHNAKVGPAAEVPDTGPEAGMELGVNRFSVDVADTKCVGQVVGDMVGGLVDSASVCEEGTAVEPAEGEDGVDKQATTAMVTVAPHAAGIPEEAGEGKHVAHVGGLVDFASVCEEGTAVEPEEGEDGVEKQATIAMVTVAPDAADIPEEAGEGKHVAVQEITPEVEPQERRRRASNIVTRLKLQPRHRKASAARGSPYMNPLQWRNRLRRVRRCVSLGKKAVEGNSEEVPTSAMAQCSIEDYVTIDGAAGSGMQAGGTTISAEEQAKVGEAAVAGRCSTVHVTVDEVKDGAEVFSNQAIEAYRSEPLSIDEAKLLLDVRKACKSLKDDEWNFDLPRGTGGTINAEFFKGLINVVPRRGAGDKAGRYCVGRFAIQLYGKLLEQRQNQHPTHCRRSIFLEPEDKGCAIHAKFVSDEIWKKRNLRELGDVLYLFLPLFEAVHQHWLLFVADLRGRRFVVYDSLANPDDRSRREVVQNATATITGALSSGADFHDASSWPTEHPTCPQQPNGHDCGVYVMVFMDQLSLGVDKPILPQRDLRQVRDNLLLSLLQGRIAHFPQALTRRT